MGNEVKENGKPNVGANGTDKTPKYVAGNPVNVDSKKSEEGKTPTPAGPTATEATKKEIKSQLAGDQLAPNLEQTLKKIKELGRLSHQRDKLILTIDNLDSFEVKQLDEAEETNLNHFQRCELTIRDDAGNDFSTKNPFIINVVAGNIKSLCIDKLAEVEAQISLNL
ncbi:hypothetical protein [Pedobacter sp.]